MAAYLPLFIELIRYFVVLLYFTNPFLKDDLKNALFNVTEDSDFVKNILKDLDKVIVNSRKEMNIGKIGGKVWNKVVDTIGFGSKNNPAQFVYFVMVSGEAYKQALVNIKKLNDVL